MLLQQEVTAEMPFLSEAEVAVTTDKCEEGEREEVLAFLAERPIHTVVMAGWIRDNGLISPLNRGTFYGCRNYMGELEGVALIGYVTLLEVRTERAVEAFARLASNFSGTHLLTGEQERINAFWNRYSAEGQPIRRACRETLFELQLPVTDKEHEPGLRLATMEELHLIIPAQAQMAFEESGVDPRETDALGFRMRCARRIEQGRVWILLEQGKLIFKADIIGETPDVFYLEGIYVAPQARGRGLGARCIGQLSNFLLAQAPSICLLVNESNREAHSLYRKVGFQERGTYETVFLRPARPAAPPAETHVRNLHDRNLTQTRPLTEQDQAEALEFLSGRPAQTMIMTGWIHDHGMESPHNGGVFYGYWNSLGILEGVALIGRMTMFETYSDAAIRALAEVAWGCASVKALMGVTEELEKFWDYYRAEEQSPRLVCQEVLYECRRPAKAPVNTCALRRGTLQDLDRIVAAHAEMVVAETGVNPLEVDPVGFRSRCARRIGQGRVWVMIKDGELLFKADIVTETPNSAYVEGIWVNPACRNQGLGTRALCELSNALLADKSSLGWFVNAQNLSAQSFYEKAGCVVRARFGKIYL
jgi:predicted GNAT family acetyltransferase